MLQEVRVAQTGAQILFGFLVSVVFAARFPQLSAADRNLYVVTVVLGATTTGALIAPVSFHRFFSGHRLKPELVQAAAKLISLGLMLLALTVASALLLLLHVAIGSPAAWILAGAVTAWFALCWLALPWSVLRLAEHRRSRDHP